MWFPFLLATKHDVNFILARELPELHVKCSHPLSCLSAALEKACKAPSWGEPPYWHAGLAPFTFGGGCLLYTSYVLHQTSSIKIIIGSKGDFE